MAVFSALVHAGDIVLAIPGKKFDATNISQLASTALDELTDFKQIERPTDWNLPALKALFELLEQPPGLAQALTQGGEQAGAAIKTLAVESKKSIENIVVAQQLLQGGLRLWSRNLLSQEDSDLLRGRMQMTKQFLESLQGYTNAGQLKTFRDEPQDVTAKGDGLDALHQVESFEAIAAEFGPLASYLATAEMALPSDHPWIKTMQGLRHQLWVEMLDSGKRESHSFQRLSIQSLSDLMT